MNILVVDDDIVSQKKNDENPVRLWRLRRGKNRKIGPGCREKSKILMVTSHSDIETVKACVGKCDGYIIKPFTKEVMTRKIQKTGLLQ